MQVKYGLISETDGLVIEKTIDLILKDFPHDETINYTEIGLFNCATAKGVRDYVLQKRGIFITGIDNQKDKPVENINYLNKFIIGDSKEVYNQIPDNSQHFIFDDGDHSLLGVIADFFAYADKVKKGGYFAFHDTGKHIAPFTDFQHGDKENPGAYISVRKALEKIGLFSQYMTSNFPEEGMAARIGSAPLGFDLIFEEGDETNPAGGVTVFKKLY
jgi:hypothetical protein